MAQSNWLIVKKKIWTWEAPGLINTKQKNLAEVKITPGRYASV
jgi:hypothetical protein